MGQIVEFPSNGRFCKGYLAVPGATGPGVVVIQEWWGLVDHIKDVCDRLAGEGFVALAPDLYHGRSTTEPDEAGKLMMDLQMDQAAKDMAGAVDELLRNPVVEPKKAGSVGFCMGGALSMFLATVKPMDATVSYYGYPMQGEPDWSKVRGPVLGHFAEHDDYFSPKKAEEVFEDMRAKGKQAELHVYEGTEHAFFNDTRAEVYNPGAAGRSWERTLAFFRQHLGA